MLRQHVVVGCVDENIDAVDEIAQGVDMRLSDYAQAQARVQTVEARVTHATVYFDALHRVSLAVLERIIADPLRFFFSALHRGSGYFAMGQRRYRTRGSGV